MALVAGVAIALVGSLVPALRWLYDYAWFVGFVVSGRLYFLLMHRPVAVLTIAFCAMEWLSDKALSLTNLS